MELDNKKQVLFQIFRMGLLRRAKSALAAALRTTEFNSRNLRQILVRISAKQAHQAMHEIQSGLRPFLGTLVSLLSEGNGSGDSNLSFVARAYERLIGKRPNDEELRKLAEALASGFAGRAEVVQSILNRPEFVRMLARAPGRPEVELAELTLYEALLIDRIQRLIHPHRLLPPASMRWKVGQARTDIYGREFEAIGRHFQAKLVRDTGLGTTSRVLDVGSGCGRIAIPLTEIIGPSGFYIGLETVASMVRWCRRNITARFPHFRFVSCAVRNSAYNPNGSEKPEEYAFPFEAGQFDLIIATSIFTHLRPASAQNYIFQCARVLKPGGKVFATAFLIENRANSVGWGPKFDYTLDEIAFMAEPSAPEAAVAYPAAWLLENLRRAKLELAKPIEWGSWSGKQPAYSGQDVLILTKRS